MKKSIALKGRADSGKSSTITKLYHKLLESDNYKLQETTFIKPGWDFRATFLVRGILIGVTSKGDTYDLVIDDLGWFKIQTVDICVCACRSKDMTDKGTNSAVKEYTDDDPVYLWKTVSDSEKNFDKSNEQDCERLFIELQKAIENVT